MVLDRTIATNYRLKLAIDIQCKWMNDWMAVRIIWWSNRRIYLAFGVLLVFWCDGHWQMIIEHRMGAEITKIWIIAATMLYSIYNLCVV